MPHLSLSPDEARIMREIIEASLVDLRREIWHTDSREFRDQLKARAECLERVLEELTAAAPAG